MAQEINMQWDKVERISKATRTLQMVVTPALRRGSPIHDRVFAEHQRLGADYVRHVPSLIVAHSSARSIEGGETQ